VRNTVRVRIEVFTAQAEQFGEFRGGDAPHNREAERVRRLTRGEAARFGQRDQMSLCSPLSPWTRVA
jgi:hypothetical protein